MSTIMERVQTLIIDKLNVEKGQVTPEARFATDLGADSLDVRTNILQNRWPILPQSLTMIRAAHMRMGSKKCCGERFFSSVRDGQ
jgi:hypothetical protein